MQVSELPNTVKQALISLTLDLPIIGKIRIWIGYETIN